MRRLELKTALPPDTNVLITRFLMPDGVGDVRDFMPAARIGTAAHRQRVIRRLLAVRGQMRFAVEVAPRFDYRWEGLSLRAIAGRPGKSYSRTSTGLVRSQQLRAAVG